MTTDALIPLSRHHVRHAVLEVLPEARRPMSVQEIADGLEQCGFTNERDRGRAVRIDHDIYEARSVDAAHRRWMRRSLRARVEEALPPRRSWRYAGDRQHPPPGPRRGA